MLHTSLRMIGLGVRGAPALYDALIGHVTVNDTALVVPAFTYNCEDPAGWNDPPVPSGQLEAYRASVTPFDRLTTSVHPEIGFMPEFIRRQIGARRSNHPVLSFAAVGPRAAEAVDNQPLHMPLGPESPLGWLVANRGVVVMAGTGMAALTLLHLAETLAPVSYVRHARRRVLSQEGWMWYWGAPSDGHGFSKAAAVLDEATLTLGRLGHAETRVVDAPLLVELAVDRLSREPGWLLCEDPACVPCSMAWRYIRGEVQSVAYGEQGVYLDEGAEADAEPD